MKKETLLFSKIEIREVLAEKRRQVPLFRRLEASSLLLEQLIQVAQNHPLILSFASRGDEIDLWPFNEWLLEHGKLVLPKLVQNEIKLFQVRDFAQLFPSKWNILEPGPSCSPVELQEISCALIPGLGFDSRFYRIGWGKGHYDHLLKSMEHTHKIGIGFKEQWIEALPIEPHDQKCNQLILT